MDSQIPNQTNSQPQPPATPPATPPAVPPATPPSQPAANQPVYPPAYGSGIPVMPSPYVPCPRCGNPYPQKVGYTWWGGVLGPSMFKHVRCPSCQYEYNGKTGKSNSTSIMIYVLVTLVIVGLIIALVASSW